MKRFIALCLAIAMVFTLVSCNSDDPVVLFFAVDEKAGSFDPQIASDDTASIVVNNCYEGLLRLDENGGIVNGVAKDYDISPDGLTYTFYLREDAVWHLTSNAKERLEGRLPENFELSVTAEDFRFALMRACDPVTGAENSYMLRNIENAEEILEGKKDRDTLGVTVKDKYTLEIKLRSPQSNFLWVLTQNICMPCNETFFNACLGRYGTLIAFLLTNGPFYLSRFDESSYRINKSPDYKGESTAVPDYVWLYVVEDSERLREVIETDDYSGAFLREEEYSLMKLDKDKTVNEIPDTVMSFILSPTDSVLSCSDIRRAIKAATSAAEVSSIAGKTAAEGLIPPVFTESKDVKYPSPYNEEAARDLLKAGLKQLGADTVSISVSCEKQYEETVRRILQEWQRILGISISFSVKTMTFSELSSQVNSGSFQIALFPVRAGSDSIYDFFGSFPGVCYGEKTEKLPLEDGETPSEEGEIPDAGTKEDTFDKRDMLDDMYSSDEKHTLGVIQKLSDTLYSESIIIPLWTQSSYMVCTKNVSGVMVFSSPDTLFFHKATNEKK